MSVDGGLALVAPQHRARVERDDGHRAAHRVAVARYGDGATRAHLPLVALMVGYTVLSLWIVPRPIVA